MTRLAALALTLLALKAHAASASLDLSGLDEAAFERLDGVTLERAATVRLVQEGFAVVSKDKDADVRLAVTLAGDLLSLEGKGPLSRERREIPFRGPLPELHLELLHKLVELARALSPPPRGASPPPKSPPPRRPSEVDPPWLLAVGSLSLLSRDGGVDPRLCLEARLGRRLRGGASLAYAPSFGPGLRVHELWPAAGAHLSLWKSARVDVELGLQLGALVHLFALDDPAADEPRGLRADPFLTVPVLALVHLGGGLCAGARAAASATLRGRQHQRGDELVWSRGPLALEAGLTLGLCKAR